MRHESCMYEEGSRHSPQTVSPFSYWATSYCLNSEHYSWWWQWNFILLFYSLASPLQSYEKLFLCLYVSTNFINVFIIGDKSTWTLFPRFSPSGVSSEGAFSSMENLSNYVSLFWLRLSLHSLLEHVTEIIILSHSMSWVAVGLACKIRRKITFQPQLTLNFSHHTRTSPLRSFMGS